MRTPRVLLTGPFGNVGQHVLAELSRRGFEAHALDLATPGNRKRCKRLAKDHRFTMHWGDLTDKARVQAVVADARPDTILHVAALIAPLAYVRPSVARAVNVEGTQNLIDAASVMPTPPRFVFTSSYTVHGPRNPHRDLPPLHGDTPLAPVDTYGRHKAEAEAAVRASGLPWSIIRLPAVLSTDPEWGRDPAFLKFYFLLPGDRREHLLDARDAGLALCNAAETSDVEGRAFVLGGPEGDCRVEGYALHKRLMKAQGLQPIPRDYFRVADPEQDASWFFEDWVDTAPSQRVLDYQRHTFADFTDFIRRREGNGFYIKRALAPLIRSTLSRKSPYIASPNPTPDPTPMWDVLRASFNIPDNAT